jgi:hypothetical protein
MIPTDEATRRRPRISPPSLPGDNGLKWEIQEFNFQVEAFKVSVGTGKKVTEPPKDPAPCPPRK